MNPFGATLVLLLTGRDAKRMAAVSKVSRTCSAMDLAEAKERRFLQTRIDQLAARRTMPSVK